MKKPNPETALISRYPGVAPFAEEQREVFFGRSQDIERLSEQVQRQQQVLLYAKSGLGKSSLINAGLVPRLLEQDPGLTVLHLRFGAYVEGASRSLLQAVLDSLEQTGLAADYSLIERVFAAESSLWAHFKARQFANKQVRFLLVFDQFEELFTYPEEDVLRFKRQMHDLLYRLQPLHFHKALAQKQQRQPDLLSQAEAEHFTEQQQIKLLVAIREDRYSLLHGLADYLPDLLRQRYALEPLNAQQAREAIEAPAATVSTRYRSAAFHYTPTALDKIINYLTKEGQRPVETTQLQILCSRLEGLGLPEVREEDIPDFQDIFLEYYFDCLTKLPTALHLPVRKFIETQLVQKGQRISLDSLLLPDFMDERVLAVLVQEQHLLRVERNSTGGLSYELSHDTLVPPIMEAYETRRREEEAQAEHLAALEAARRAETEREEAARRARLAAVELRKQKRQLYLTRFLLLLTFLGFLGAAIAAFMALKAKAEAAESAKKAEEGKQLADAARLEAEAARQRADSLLLEVSSRQQEAQRARTEAVKAKNVALAEKSRAENARQQAEYEKFINQLNYNEAANFRLPRLFVEGNNYLDVKLPDYADKVIADIEKDLQLMQPIRPQDLRAEDRPRFFSAKSDPRDKSGKTKRKANFWAEMINTYQKELQALKKRRKAMPD